MGLRIQDIRIDQSVLALQDEEYMVVGIHANGMIDGVNPVDELVSFSIDDVKRIVVEPDPA